MSLRLLLAHIMQRVQHLQTMLVRIPSCRAIRRAGVLASGLVSRPGGFVDRPQKPSLSEPHSAVAHAVRPLARRRGGVPAPGPCRARGSWSGRSRTGRPHAPRAARPSGNQAPPLCTPRQTCSTPATRCPPLRRGRQQRLYRQQHCHGQRAAPDVQCARGAVSTPGAVVPEQATAQSGSSTPPLGAVRSAAHAHDSTQIGHNICSAGLCLALQRFERQWRVDTMAGVDEGSCKGA